VRKILISLLMLSGVLFGKETYEAKITELINAGSYTYLGVKNEDKEYWVVTSRIELPIGAWIRFEKDLSYEKYHSEALNRDFENVIFTNTIYFRTDIEESKNVDFMTEPLEKSPFVTNKTVSLKEMQDKKDSLNGKEILFRAKVAKVSKNILDRNWIHLQDGTGVPNEGEPVGRVVATSKESPKVGDVVTVKGTLSVDKSFGSGYVYPLIIEQATFSK